MRKGEIMPTRTEINVEIQEAKSKSQDIIRRNYLADLANYTKRDTVILASAFSSTTKKLLNMPGSVFSINIGDIEGFMSAFFGLKNKKLDLIIHSPGGQLEAS
jgi:hypothetical protein